MPREHHRERTPIEDVRTGGKAPRGNGRRGHRVDCFLVACRARPAVACGRESIANTTRSQSIYEYESLRITIVIARPLRYRVMA
jgi:hypothetical protein